MDYYRKRLEKNVAINQKYLMESTKRMIQARGTEMYNIEKSTREFRKCILDSAYYALHDDARYL